MTAPPPQHSISVELFRTAIAALDVRRALSVPAYARRRVLASAPANCPLCCVPFDLTRPAAPAAPKVASLLHPSLGGPLVPENLFVCCRSCQQRRASGDLLEELPLPDALASQRLAALLLSSNHLVSTSPSASLSDVKQALAKRHAFPRSRVYAAQTEHDCLLGVSSRYGGREAKGIAHLLGKQAGRRVSHSRYLAVYRLDDADFCRVIWQLIEANAMVVGVARRLDARDYRDHWWVASASLSELRAHRVAGVDVPRDRAERVVGERAVRARRHTATRRREKELERARDALVIAESRLDAWFAARNSNRGFPVDAREGQALSQVRLEACRRVSALEDQAAT